MKKYCIALGMILTAIPLCAQAQLQLEITRSLRNATYDSSDQTILTTTSTGASDEPGNVELLIKVLNAGVDLDQFTFTTTDNRSVIEGQGMTLQIDVFDNVQSRTASDDPGNLEVLVKVLNPEVDLDQFTFATTDNRSVIEGQGMVLVIDVWDNVPRKTGANPRVVTFTATVQPANADDGRPDLYLNIWINQTEIPQLVAEPDPIPSGGEDSDLLIGGQTGFEETDIQTGGAGRDVLIGGAGSDR